MPALLSAPIVTSTHGVVKNSPKCRYNMRGHSSPLVNELTVANCTDTILRDFFPGRSTTSHLGAKSSPKRVATVKRPAKSSLATFLSIKTPVSADMLAQVIDRDRMESKERLPLNREVLPIGKGRCGEIFHLVELGKVFKKPHPGTDQLKNEYETHKAVYQAIEDARLIDETFDLRVPKVTDYYESDDDLWWEAFPQPFEPVELLLTDRIMPLLEETRAMLIQKFCPPRLRREARFASENQDCLMRVYLGRRSDADSRHSWHRNWTGLRDFEADLSLFDEVDLPKEPVAHARAMAIALARMHFQARIDARGVEFVLGAGNPKLVEDKPTQWDDRPSHLMRREERRKRRKEKERRNTRLIGLWLLDFDQCSAISMDHAGMGRAVGAYFDNDPYYPRAACMGLWDTFRGVYVDEAKRLGQEGLARYFVSRIEEKDILGGYSDMC